MRYRITTRQNILQRTTRRLEPAPVGVAPTLNLVVALVVIAMVAMVPAAAVGSESNDCGTVHPDSTVTPEQCTPDPTWTAPTIYKYVPDSLVAPIGSKVVEFTYTQTVANSQFAGSVPALKAALDSLAARLCDTVDNPTDLDQTDMAIMHDLYQITASRDKPYGDSWFALQANGAENCS